MFHVVLHEPEIPNNTGNIGRTCVAIGATLHLVRPLGFELSARACRRAGLDYWPRLVWREHADWSAFLSTERPARVWALSTHGTRSVFEADLRAGDALVFGKETRGLPEPIRRSLPPERVLRMPMVEGERSLNLATAVCAVAYEGVRQELARGAARIDAGVLRHSFRDERGSSPMPG